jgi:hypothetical protein
MNRRVIASMKKQLLVILFLADLSALVGAQAPPPRGTKAEMDRRAEEHREERDHERNQRSLRLNGC